MKFDVYLGSVATCKLQWENDKDFIANSLLNPTVKKFENQSTNAEATYECRVACVFTHRVVLAVTVLNAMLNFRSAVCSPEPRPLFPNWFYHRFPSNLQRRKLSRLILLFKCVTF